MHTLHFPSLLSIDNITLGKAWHVSVSNIR